jgi:aromatic ring-opening dioxygenase catalytic subunit (LigB family)
MLAFAEGISTSGSDELLDSMGPKSKLASFLSDLGPTLVRKYKPKGIVVFSAHWETDGQRFGMLP